MTEYSERRTGYERVIEPLASPAANYAVTRYCGTIELDPNVAERPDFLDHARRVCSIVYAYADDLVAPEIYDVALMHDLPDRATESSRPLRKQAAARELADYFTATHSHDESYVAHVMADLGYVEQSAEQCRDVLDSEIGEMLAHNRAALWASETPPIDVEHLARVAHHTNLEAIIIKAAESIDNLIHHPQKETALLHDVTEAERFYAPLCEVAGLDALAMRLRSEATKRRFERLGRHDLLLQARQQHEDAARFGIEDELPQLLGADEIKFDYVPGMHLDGGEFSWFGSARVSGGPLDGCSIRYRLKSIGSIAKKIASEPSGKPPLDTLAVTVITDHHGESGRVFRSAVDHAYAHDRVQLTEAPTKQAPLYIQGTEKYVRAASRELCDRDTCQQQIYPTAPSTYNVAKYTARMMSRTGVESGIEVQVVSEHDRRRARIGETAHIIFKQQKAAGRTVDYSELVHLLADMYDRKHHIDKSGQHVNKGSVPRTEAMLADVWEQVERVSG